MKLSEIFLLLSQVVLAFEVITVQTRRSRHKRRRNRNYRQENRPNIIFIMADDLDVALGSPEIMLKTKRLLREGGTEFKNAFVTSSICCPSRSSILTGRYAHNHHVNSNKASCGDKKWRKGPEQNTIGKLMQEAGYRTGEFIAYWFSFQLFRLFLPVFFFLRFIHGPKRLHSFLYGQCYENASLKFCQNLRTG